MSLQACADIVARSDPTRFRATMAAPIAARRVLFPIYAFAVEVARAPYVTQEPLIAEMRLQWWRDALEEIAAGGAVRRHEVTTPLAEGLVPEAARILDAAVAARRQDIEREPVLSQSGFETYLDATGAGLAWAAALSLGADRAAEPGLRAKARASALVRYFQAIPALLAQGRQPLIDTDPDSLRALAGVGRTWGRATLALPRRHEARAALLEGWATSPLLHMAQSDPSRIREGRLTLAPLADRWHLFRTSLAT